VRLRSYHPENNATGVGIMAKRLAGKIAVVTAAGQGIGRAIAEAFVAEGATVFATDLNTDLLDGIPRAKKRKLDVLSSRAVQSFAEKAGAVDILVNAAGFVHHGTVMQCSDKDWDFSFDLNVKSMHRTIQAFLPGMLKRAQESGKSASIVNIASGAGSVRGIPNRYVYGATKAAVIGLTKAVAADYIKQGVRANAICPGTIQSPSLDGRIRDVAAMNKMTEAQARQMFIDRQPMGRLGTAEEIAMLAVYLASDEASYTTGQIHLADGGFAL
jgi:2-keto-3-deoxy-L-fuconate dehydrogenase